MSQTNPGAPPSERRQAPSMIHDITRLTDDDLYLFNEGTHAGLADKLGAHLQVAGETPGAYFAVWAPNAETVSVIGDFNGWDSRSHPLRSRGGSGVWEGFAPGVGQGALYKFHLVGLGGQWRGDKTDPFAASYEPPPKTASVVWDPSYTWGDSEWLAARGGRGSLSAPITIYEVHLGSWMRDRADPERLMSYRELAPRLADYANRLGFTHVELLPVMEHPFYGSWGYQTTGYFAPSSRYGTPQDFMWMVDQLHQAGIGVILDWVPSHFPRDEFALGLFDGTHLFEHADPRQGIHPDWDSYVFNYSRNEVRSFLISSAMHWLGAYHADGLRVDAVASMLYLDYSRKQGEWIPNEHGGRENLAAIDFLRRLNEHVYTRHPDVQTVAEESTAWPMVSRPVYLGGLGFGMKWDMGWMHDTLYYMGREPVHRKYHHNNLTFRQLYAFTENFVLPLSHDEVVHGKGSLIGKMPGDEWQRFANLRLLLGYMYAQTGKKLLFMGGEIGQRREWNHDSALDWQLLEEEGGRHAGVQQWVNDLNRLYRSEPALHELDSDPGGFEWIDANDNEASVLTFLRRSRSGETILVACNFTPVVRHTYLVGVPFAGFWREILNSDAWNYGGSGVGNLGGVETLPFSGHGRPRTVNLALPPLGCVFLKGEGRSE
jgi:1,4-alpha-glucan branching enzyme